MHLNDSLYLYRRQKYLVTTRFFLSISSELLFILKPQIQESLDSHIIMFLSPIPPLPIITAEDMIKPKTSLLGSIPNTNALTIPLWKRKLNYNNFIDLFPMLYKPLKMFCKKNSDYYIWHSKYFTNFCRNYSYHYFKKTALVSPLRSFATYLWRLQRW